MQDNFLFLQRLPQRSKVDIGQRIDNEIVWAVVRDTQLKQAKFLAIGMQAVRFCIDGDARSGSDFVEQFTKLGGIVDDPGRR